MKLVPDDLIQEAIRNHPMPWRVEADWTWEVLDAHGDIVAKFPYPSIEGLEKAKYLIREAFAQMMLRNYETLIEAHL